MRFDVKKNTILFGMLGIGFIGFLASVFTGSVAFAAVAAGFFGGATCMVAISLTEALGGIQPEAKTVSAAEEPKSPKMGTYVKPFITKRVDFASLGKSIPQKEVAHEDDQVSDDIPFIA